MVGPVSRGHTKDHLAIIPRFRGAQARPGLGELNSDPAQLDWRYAARDLDTGASAAGTLTTEGINDSEKAGLLSGRPDRSLIVWAAFGVLRAFSSFVQSDFLTLDFT